MASNDKGYVDVFKRGVRNPVKCLPLEQIRCSFVMTNPATQEVSVFVGSHNKLCLISGESLEVISTIKLARQILSICSLNNFTVVCGTQGGQLAAVFIEDKKTMVIQAENKLTNAIYKVIRTRTDNVFALATSTGLKFAKLNSDRKAFVLA